MNDTPPICRNCRHYIDEFNSCDHPQVQTFDPVRGYQDEYAPRAREGKCGFDGLLFEPWPERKPVKYFGYWFAFVILGLIAVVVKECVT